jgi:hypothetical protein
VNCIAVRYRPVREIVMVVADLYLPRDAQTAPKVAAGFAQVPGIERAGRFGEHQPLADGWRAWLARALGRTGVSDAAAGRVAGAVLASPPGDNGASWIATPVHLSAGLTRVHLDHRGILRLSAEELAVLAADFRTTFGAAGLSLRPLPSGELLLETPGIPAVATLEPARCAGGEVEAFLPPGPQAAPLRRVLSEIEMWLHAHALNEARRRRGELPLTTLWLWGATGGAPRREARTRAPLPPAFGADAWLRGLWHLEGSVCQALPERLETVLTVPQAEQAVLVAEVGRELQRAREGTVAEALARLDERLISPAVRALRLGELARLTLILNDARVTLGRVSHFRLWRRRRVGLASFA